MMIGVVLLFNTILYMRRGDIVVVAALVEIL